MVMRGAGLGLYGVRAGRAWRRVPALGKRAVMGQIPKECANCGEPFVASRTAARYCTPRCRKAYSRRPKARQRQPDEKPHAREASPPPADGGNAARASERLRSAGRLDSWEGYLAVWLAEQLDMARGQPASGVASLAEKFTAAMDRALREAEEPSKTARLNDQIGAARKAKAQRGRRAS